MLTMTDSRQPLASILTVAGPIQEFWQRYVGNAKPPGAPVSLDLLLTHLLLDLHPGQPLVVDRAAQATAGATTILAIRHKKPCRVISTATGSVARAIAEYTAETGTKSPITAQSECAPPSAHDGVLFLLHASQLEGDAASTLDDLLDHPHHMVIVFDVGPFDRCPATAHLCRTCGTGTGRRLWFAREQAESLGASQLAVMASERHPHAHHIMDRLGLFYRGNFRFIEMLEQTIAQAIVASGAAERAIQSHPAAHTLRNAEPKRPAEDLTQTLQQYQQIVGSPEDAVKLAAQCQAAQKQVAILSAEMHALHNTLSFRTASRMRRVRRRLAPEGTISHKLFSRCLRVMRRLTRLIRPVR